jgi:hypothetical protein
MNIKELAEQAEDYANKELETVPKLGWFNLRDKKFAELVAAAEREECAKLMFDIGSAKLAEAIRARSKV